MLLIAPDKFKGTLGAGEVAAALVRGVRRARPAMPVDECPVADGGEGTLRVLEGPLRLEPIEASVRGPRWERLRAAFGVAADRSVALVELAEASGLDHLPPQHRDATRTTTYGTGQLVRAAIEQGARRVVVALGGSATCDGGVGLAQALGVVFRDARGEVMEAPLTGEALLRVASWSADASILGRQCTGSHTVVEAAVDVESPLLGPLGAARVFAPQKGASPEQVEILERGLGALVRAVPEPGASRSAGAGCHALSPEAIARLPGAGAAGGCGFGLALFCGATLRPGVDLVLDAIGFESRVRRAALVVTGEGRLDASSLAGKAAVAVARAARRHGVPTMIVAGDVASEFTGERQHEVIGEQGLFREAVSLSERFGRERAMRQTASCLADIGAEIALRAP